MSVVSQSNKQMLFDLLKSIGNENNFVIDDKQLMTFITQKCGYFHANRFEFDFGNDLNEINKKIVEQGYNLIMSNQPRKVPQKASSRQPQQQPQQQQLSNRKIFDEGLATQEAQFKKMINPKKPKEIDFSDGSEDFPMQNLGEIMNQTLSDREKELETITQKYSNSEKQKAQKWLNREEDTPRIKIEKSSNLKLDNTISISNTEKRVRFEVNDTVKEPPKGLTNLFSKLKQKTPNNDIINKLDTIISNQEKILELLTIQSELDLSSI